MSINNLTNLTTLDLRGNQLMMLPESIGNLMSANEYITIRRNTDIIRMNVEELDLHDFGEQGQIEQKLFRSARFMDQ